MSGAALCRLDAQFAPVVARSGPMAITPRAQEPYVALVIAVAGQQLHARAAAAILGRLTALHPAGFPAPAMLLETADAQFRACGFSAGKTAAVRAIAAATLAGTVPSRAAAEAMDDAALIARLTTLRGVGRWTVEMLLIFTLGRGDVLPVDDWAVRERFRLLTGAAVPPKPRALAEHGQRWAPYRTTAAWYLWRLADEAKRRPS